MADHGEVVRRLLEPGWSTIVGTFRDWTSVGADHPITRFESWPEPRGSGPPRREEIPVEVESWCRIWLRGREEHRIERFSPGDEPAVIEIVGPGGAVAVVPGRSATRLVDAPPTPWELHDVSPLVGLFRFTIDDERTFAGRRAVRLLGEIRSDIPPRFRESSRPFFGQVAGDRCEVLLDVQTGISLRVAHFWADRLVRLSQYTEIAVDVDVPDEVLTYSPGPGERIRGPHDDLLDGLEAHGVDVSGIDRDDAIAVRAALHRHERAQRSAPLPGPMPPRPAKRAMSEITIPMGPPPADPGAARSAIADTIAGLSPDDDAPRAAHIERGDLIDRAWEDSPPPAHPMVGDAAVTFTLTDVFFLREDEALVEYTIGFGSTSFGQVGRVVQRDGRWLVSYDTFARLQAMGGIVVPSVHTDR